MCHNIGPSTIIIDDGDQYFKKNSNFHSTTCQILMDGWKLPMSTCQIVAVVELHDSWKWIVST